MSDDVVDLPESLQLLAKVGTADDPYQSGGKWAYADGDNMSGRCFFITQNTEYQGSPLLTQDQVEQAVARKGMTSWAYILHDKDVYDDAAVDAGNCPPGTAPGDPKADHYHVVVRRKTAATVGAVARAFGVPPQQVEKKPGGAFLDLVEYLTHENANQSGKHQYDRSEVVTCIDDLWEKLDEHVEKRVLQQTGGVNVFRAVSDGEMTLDEVRQQFPELYVKKGNLAHLQKLRGDYLSRAVPPSVVINIYIFGPGGVGKDLLARALAKSLTAHPEKPFFKVGGQNVGFENYDGEDVIIWEDCRVGDMINHLGSRGMLFRLLGPYRDVDDRITVNVKHSKTSLINGVNLITGPDDYETFLDGLAGQYIDRLGVEHKSENQAQSYRRFPLIIPVAEGTFGIYINQGFLNGTREYFAYEKYEGFRQSLEQVRRRAKAITDADERASAIEEVDRRTVAPILKHVDALTEADASDALTAADLLDEFSAVGTVNETAESLKVFAANLMEFRSRHGNFVRGFDREVTERVYEDEWGPYIEGTSPGPDAFASEYCIIATQAIKTTYYRMSTKPLRVVTQ